MADNRVLQLVHDREVERLARQLLLDLGVPTSAEIVGQTAKRIETVIDRAVAAERERCVRMCRERAELWAATSPVAQGTEERRARTNEATYLADLIAGG